jgi:hypothetical protein
VARRFPNCTSLIAADCLLAFEIFLGAEESIKDVIFAWFI